MQYIDHDYAKKWTIYITFRAEMLKMIYKI